MPPFGELRGWRGACRGILRKGNQNLSWEIHSLKRANSDDTGPLSFLMQLPAFLDRSGGGGEQLNNQTCENHPHQRFLSLFGFRNQDLLGFEETHSILRHTLEAVDQIRPSFKLKSDILRTLPAEIAEARPVQSLRGTPAVFANR